MIISLIVTLTHDHIIGHYNNIPWFIPADRVWFKYHTIYKPIIMGRKTYDSIGGEPLPNRINIILSRKYRYSIDYSHGIFFVNDLDQALLLVKMFSEVMVIGGGEIYHLFFSLACRLYLTYVKINIVGGNVKFPFYNVNLWRLVYNVSGIYYSLDKATNSLKDINYCFKVFKKL